MIKRIAYLSIHTCPLARPGSGDAGGMNVYVDGLARTMAKRGVQVEVFTRQNDQGGQGVVEVEDGYRVVHIDLGPDNGDLLQMVSGFTAGVMTWAAENGASYDVVLMSYLKENLIIQLLNLEIILKMVIGFLLKHQKEKNLHQKIYFTGLMF
ncbi:MAG: glycosyltransferase [Acidimicrobiia bacterium]|nr:glycosyltransferase [Acidimicrobiia bacterium]